LPSCGGGQRKLTSVAEILFAGKKHVAIDYTAYNVLEIMAAL
jgi:hypothetical protein